MYKINLRGEKDELYGNCLLLFYCWHTVPLCSSVLWTHPQFCTDPVGKLHACFYAVGESLLTAAQTS